MGIFRKILGGAFHAGNVIATFFLGLIMFLMGAEIIARRVFNKPIPGTFEVVEASMAILCTIGFAYALQEGRHIRATFLTDRLSSVGRHWNALYTYVIGIIVIGLFLWYQIMAAVHSLALREYTSGIVAFPIYIPKIIVAFAVFLFWIAFLLLFIDGIREKH